MKCFKYLLVGAVCALALGASVRSASADLVSYSSGSFSGQSSFTAQFPEFNPTLGTLLSATVSLNADVTLIASVLNPSASPEPFSYAFCTTLTTNPVTDQVIFTPSPLVWTDPYGNSAQTDATTLIQPGVANAGPYSVTNFPGTPVPAGLVSNVPAPDLTNFVGVGSTSFTYSGSGGMNYGGSDLSLFFGGNRLFSGDATIYYTYTSTPEPTSFGLMAASALALLKRRRKA